MPDNSISMVAASLWDLRTQCEQQLRSLTDAQRLTDEFRERADARAVLKRKLVADLDSVLRTNQIVREAAQDCARLVRELPTGDAEPLQT